MEIVIIKFTLVCPHCGHEDVYVFHDDKEMLECHNCGKPMDIELETKITVRATLPIRKCCLCDSIFER